MPQHEFILKVHNHPGVLIRVAQVFTRRSFNIDALEVKPDPKNPAFATNLQANRCYRSFVNKAQFILAF